MVSLRIGSDKEVSRMKKIISMLVIFVLLVVSYAPAGILAEESVPVFKSVGDPKLLDYVEGTIYEELVSTLNSDGYFVENVSAIYISQEYLDELAYNSQANVFFGYTLQELEKQFQGKKYIFTLGTNNETIVEPWTAYDDPYERVVRNVAVGTGVILICVTVSVVSAGVGAPAVSMVFAVGAKTGATCALSSAAIGGVSAGIVTGIQTGDMNAALQAAALAGSEEFKWGAISGAISGAAGEAIALKGATINGLTMNQAAAIQKESGYPLDVIKTFNSMEQYDICKKAGLSPKMIDGKIALVRNIDIDFTDEFGRTNLQRMQEGLAALDPLSGESYQLHHIGQEMDSTLAILTHSEHMQGGNNLIWHELGEATKINRNVFDKQRMAFWKNIAEVMKSTGAA